MKKKPRAKIEQATLNACVRCGYSRQAHELANYADGPMIGRPVLICPTATGHFPAPPPETPA